MARETVVGLELALDWDGVGVAACASCSAAEDIAGPVAIDFLVGLVLVVEAVDVVCQLSEEGAAAVVLGAGATAVARALRRG